MIIKPQDIFVLLKLASIGSNNWTYNLLAAELFMSPSEVHAAVNRSLKAQLAIPAPENPAQPNIRNLLEFLVHGIRYVFVPDRGGMTRGMPTCYAASPLKQKLVASDEPPPVWPDAEGETRGQAFSPLYASVPKAARHDPKLYELLVLVDALRGGAARERTTAASELRARLGG
jgi:hypothetical protein